MKKEKTIFLIISIVLIGVLLIFTIKRETTLFALLFFATLLLIIAFYLFRYGNLSQFKVQAFSAGATFIREKKEEVEKDVNSVNKMKDQIKSLLKDSMKTRDELESINNQILYLSKGLKETYELAKPNSLYIDRIEQENIGDSYLARLFLKLKDKKALGLVTIKVFLIKSKFDTKIIDLYAGQSEYGKGGYLRSSDDCTSIAQDGKSAELIYQSITFKDPIIEVVLNGLGKLQISGSHDLKPFDFEIKG